MKKGIQARAKPPAIIANAAQAIHVTQHMNPDYFRIKKNENGGLLCSVPAMVLNGCKCTGMTFRAFDWSR